MREEISTNSQALQTIKVLWCSGYHICLTRRRSPVRNRAAPEDFFFPSHPTNGIEKIEAKKKKKEEGGKKWNGKKKLSS